MKKFLMILVVLAMVIPELADAKRKRRKRAKAKRIGIGVQLGDPTGLTAKYRLTRRNSVEGAIGSTDGRINLNAHYLWRRPGIIKPDGVPIDLYYGFGARMKEKNNEGDDEFFLGVRAPIGLRIQLRDPAFEFYAAIAGTLDIIQDTEFDLSLSVGTRFFF